MSYGLHFVSSSHIIFLTVSQGGFLPAVLWKTHITNYTITKISCADKTAFPAKQEIVNWGPFLVLNSLWGDEPKPDDIRHPYSQKPASLVHFPLWNQLKYFSNLLTKHGQNPCGQQRQLVLLSGRCLQVEDTASDLERRIAMLFDGKQSLAAYLHTTGFLPKLN